MAVWENWIGREDVREDRVDAAVVGRWLAALDLPSSDAPGVPQAFHWCLCLPDAPTGSLGLDGHPRRNDNPDSFMPPVPLPRRMWAASAVEFLQPLTLGGAIRKTSRIAAVSEKSGSTGNLAFVDVEHQVHSGTDLLLQETQTLVYRDAVAPGAPLTPADTGDRLFDPSGWDTHRRLTPDEALLFRFSALTFNTHRIHYDLPYTQQVERYRGLVVHGPLMATVLMQMAQEQFGMNALSRFAFRAVSPAICGDALHLVLRGSGERIALAAFANDGRQIMTADAAIRT